MRTIYIDSDFKCHVTDDGTMTAVETSFFDGKCDVYVEGFLFIPPDKRLAPSDDVVYSGMITPCKPLEELDAAQREYERQKLADAETALAILLGGESE